jgi:hypothetical protein
MAANPLPKPRTETATFTVDAATVTGNIPSTGSAVANNTIAWVNPPGSITVNIKVHSVGGSFPFAVNDFPPILAGTTYTSKVQASAPPNAYPFDRNGSAGIGHIVVGTGMPKPTRAK